MAEFLAQYRHARAWRECPVCHGRGAETDWKAIARGAPENRWDRRCYLCGGDGEVRFTVWIAFRVAIGWTNGEIRAALEHEPHFRVTPSGVGGSDG